MTERIERAGADKRSDEGHQGAGASPGEACASGSCSSCRAMQDGTCPSLGSERAQGGDSDGDTRTAEAAGGPCAADGRNRGQARAHGIEKLPQSQFNQIKHVIAVMSGKGGVGKSSVTALLATSLARAGHSVGVLDADITGPSIPRMFGTKRHADSFEFGILPVKSEILKIPVMSINLLLPAEDDPVIWRGPIIANVVKQFWTDVIWGDLDFLLVDLPPGTGDAPLTVMQSLPLDGIVIVSSPQDLAVMVVKKAIKMAKLMKTHVLGLIENMSYVTCPKCGEKLELFGPSKGQAVAEASDIPLLATLPLDPQLSALCDAGRVEDYDTAHLAGVVDFIVKLADHMERLQAKETKAGAR